MLSTTVIFPVSQYNPKFYCWGIQQEHAPLSLFSRNFYALLCHRSKVLIWGFLPIPHHTDRSLVRCKIMRYMRGDQTGKKPCITIKRPPIVEQRVIRSGPYFRDLRPQKHSWLLLYNNSTNTVSIIYIQIPPDIWLTPILWSDAPRKMTSNVQSATIHFTVEPHWDVGSLGSMRTNQFLELK